MRQLHTRNTTKIGEIYGCFGLQCFTIAYSVDQRLGCTFCAMATVSVVINGTSTPPFTHRRRFFYNQKVAENVTKSGKKHSGDFMRAE